MKGVKAKITRQLPIGAYVDVCDNSGAKVIKITGVRKIKTRKGRVAAAGVGDLIVASVKKGRPDMRKKVVFAVIVRQKKEYRRRDGTRIKFESNAAVVLKDDKGNPKGTMIKGPVAREAAEKWPAISKLSKLTI